MTEQNKISTTISKPSKVQKWVVALIMIVAAILSLYYSMNHYSDGGCDGGLCGLLLIFHAAPLAVAWIFTLLSFAIFKVARIASIGLLAIAIIINAALLFMDFGTHLEELDVPIVILFAAQAYVFFQWQSAAAKPVEDTPRKESE